MPKKLKEGPFSLSRYCMLRGKREKPFWFSSLGQMIQFGTIKFRKTFKNYFGQFVWIEKNSHYNSRVLLHEVPTKNIVSRKIKVPFEVFRAEVQSVKGKYDEIILSSLISINMYNTKL